MDMEQIIVISILCVVACNCNVVDPNPSLDNKLMVDIEKRSDFFGDFALADYLFKLGDINKDKHLDQNEIYNFYRHFIKFDFDKAAAMAVKLMKLGDMNGDQKLDEIEAVIAMNKVTTRLTEKKNEKTG